MLRAYTSCNKSVNNFTNSRFRNGGWFPAAEWILHFAITSTWPTHTPIHLVLLILHFTITSTCLAQSRIQLALLSLYHGSPIQLALLSLYYHLQPFASPIQLALLSLYYHLQPFAFSHPVGALEPIPSPPAFRILPSSWRTWAYTITSSHSHSPIRLVVLILRQVIKRSEQNLTFHLHLMLRKGWSFFFASVTSCR
jgi:hypothetical protein